MDFSVHKSQLLRMQLQRPDNFFVSPSQPPHRLATNLEMAERVSYLNLVRLVELKVVKPHGETAPLGVAHAVGALLSIGKLLGRCTPEQ